MIDERILQALRAVVDESIIMNTTMPMWGEAELALGSAPELSRVGDALQRSIWRHLSLDPA